MVAAGEHLHPSILSRREMFEYDVQGYLAHMKTPTPLEPPKDPRYCVVLVYI